MVIRFCLPSRFLLLLLVALPVACTTTTIDEKRVGSASVGSGDAIVVLGRRHSSDYETEPDFIRCIGRGVAASGAHVVPEIEFLNAFYPWFEPRTAPMSLERLDASEHRVGRLRRLGRLRRVGLGHLGRRDRQRGRLLLGHRCGHGRRGGGRGGGDRCG